MINQVWESLKAAPGQGQGVMSRRVLPDARLDIFAAVRKPKNVPMLIVETSTQALPHDLVLPDASGFSVVLTPVEPRGRVQIELELMEPGGEPVFLALVEDVLIKVTGADSEAGATSQLVAAINRWQRFFKAHGYRGLSRERQQGLFGELLFLRGELATAASAETAIRAWTGPNGSNQDFEYGGHGFEVKTTASNPLSEVRISNLRQLDDEVVESLHLVVVEVERHENAAGTLPQAVEETRMMVVDAAPHMAFDLADKLAEYGYLDQHSRHYANTGYGVRAVRVFTVGEGFPRITEADVPHGVGNVKYSISMAALADFELPLDEIREAMKGWFGELG